MQKIPFISLLVGIAWSNQNCSPLKRWEFQGLKHTHSQVVERELGWHIGTCLDPRQIEKARAKLMSLDLFAQVQSHWFADSGLLQLQFTELPQWLILPAVNKTDLEGWSLGAQGAFLNLGGRDIRLEARWSTALNHALEQQEGFFQLSSPWLGSLPLEYKWVYAKVHSQQKTWLEKSHRGEFELNFPSNQAWQAIFKADFNALDTTHAPGWQVPFYAGVGLGFKRESRDQNTHPSQGSLLEQRWQFFGPYPSQFWLSQTEVQHWTKLSPSWIWQNGFLLRARQGRIPQSALYQTGGPNSLRSYSPDFLGYSQSEGLAQSEIQWRAIPERSFKLPILGWDLYTGMDLVLGLESAYLTQSKLISGQSWPGFFGGMHFFVPGFERIRLEVGMPLRGPQIPQFSIGLFQKISTQVWTRR